MSTSVTVGGGSDRLDTDASKLLLERARFSGEPPGPDSTAAASRARSSAAAAAASSSFGREDEEAEAAAVDAESFEPTLACELVAPSATSESRRRLLGESEPRRSTGGGSGGHAAVYDALLKDEDGREPDFGATVLGSGIPEASKASEAPPSVALTGEFSVAPASAVAAPNVGLSTMEGRSCASPEGSRSGCSRLSLLGPIGARPTREPIRREKGKRILQRHGTAAGYRYRWVSNYLGSRYLPPF